MDTNSHRINVALRIYSQSMTITMISHMLQTQPTQYFDKGTPISPRSIGSKLRTEFLWIHEMFFYSPNTLDDGIRTVLKILELNADNVYRCLPEIQMDLFCGFRINIEQTSNAISLDSELIKRISAFPLDILVDVLPV